jgi:hypothetical protein
MEERDALNALRQEIGGFNFELPRIKDPTVSAGGVVTLGFTTQLRLPSFIENANQNRRVLQ